MNALLYSLYHFAGEYQVDNYLKQEKELEDNEKMCTAIIEELKAVLSPLLQRRLEDYTYGRDVMESASAEAFFCSGLTMGLYLGGLGSTLVN